MKRFFPPSFFDPLSLAGAGIFLFTIGLIIFPAVVETFSLHHRPYADIIIFIVLPVIVFSGPAGVRSGRWGVTLRTRGAA